MRPDLFDPSQQLVFARTHMEELREDWRLANCSGANPRARVPPPSPLRRARTRAGRALILIGRRLLPADAPAGRIAAAGHPDWGC